MSKVRMLVTYHDQGQLPHGLLDYPDLFQPVFIPTNKFFESHLFKVDYGDLNNYDYIGHVAYSYKKKIQPIDFEKIVELHAPQADIIALMYAPQHDLYMFAETFHKGFTTIWKRLIELLGYGNYMDYGTPPSFYCNYWIMKREVFLRYRTIATKAMELIETDEILRNLCYMDSNYQGTHTKLSEEKLKSISGKPYYTFHPFILERLICFIAVAEGFKTSYLSIDQMMRYPKNEYFPVAAKHSRNELSAIYPFML